MKVDTMIHQTIGLATLLLTFTTNRIGAVETNDLTAFTGTSPVGNWVFAGAMEPFGFAKVGIAGNAGFTHTAISGATGISYGHYHNVLLRPLVGALTLDRSKWGNISRATGSNNTSLLAATVGEVGTLVTATRRCAIYEFTYKGTEDLHVLVDASARSKERSAWQFGSHIEVTAQNELAGWHRFGGGWAGDQDVVMNTYPIFFVVRIEGAPTAFGTWRAGNVKPGNRDEPDTGHPSVDLATMSLSQARDLQKKVNGAPADAIGGYLTLPKSATGKYYVKIGLSQISIDQARKNLDAEIPGWSIPEIETKTRSKWNEALGGIQIETADARQKTAFYQAFRNCLVTPTDKANEHRQDPTAPYYDDWLAGWDSYPCKESLLMLALPKRYGRMMDGMLTACKYLGNFCFDVLVMNAPGPYQGYCSSEIWLAEAIQKDIPFDQKAGFALLLNNATNPPPAAIERGVGRNGGSYDWNRNRTAFKAPGTEGSGDYALCLSQGDYAIALAARTLGDPVNAAKFQTRALEWRKQWDDKAGVFSPQGFFNESDPWRGQFNLRSDVAGLIQVVGGKDEMLKRLDKMGGSAIGKPYRPGNEPFIFWPVIYHWLGLPARTAWLTRGATRFRPDTQDGMLLVGPGDDDGGGLTAYYIWCALGLYPVAGQDVYLITSPCFPRVTFNRDGKPFTIIAYQVSRENLYVQSATLNGKPLTRAWFRHDEIANGGTLVLVMGPQPSNWGQAEPPPSASLHLIRKNAH